MQLTLCIVALAAPLAAIAAPADVPSPSMTLAERQTALVKPPPCIRNNATTLHQTKKRSKAFAKAFIYTQNITEAFTYIVSDYIVRPHLLTSTDAILSWPALDSGCAVTNLHLQNHNPFAKNGSDSAWSILSPIWAAQNITPLRTTFQGTQSWLEYNNTVFGKVVDRFRWEDGCIAEHVSTSKTID